MNISSLINAFLIDLLFERRSIGGADETAFLYVRLNFAFDFDSDYPTVDLVATRFQLNSELHSM